MSVDSCSVCKWASFGGPPCYYHHNRFGIGKLTTTIRSVAATVIRELDETATEAEQELLGAIVEESDKKGLF